MTGYCSSQITWRKTKEEREKAKKNIMTTYLCCIQRWQEGRKLSCANLMRQHRPLIRTTFNKRVSRTLSEVRNLVSAHSLHFLCSNREKSQCNFIVDLYKILWGTHSSFTFSVSFSNAFVRLHMEKKISLLEFKHLS